MNTKDRRHSGRKTTVIYHPEKEPYEETHWDDWVDHRDSQRNGKDKTLIKDKNMYASSFFNVAEDNNKNFYLNRRRKIRKKRLMERIKGWQT